MRKKAISLLKTQIRRRQQSEVAKISVLTDKMAGEVILLIKLLNARDKVVDLNEMLSNDQAGSSRPTMVTQNGVVKLHMEWIGNRVSDIRAELSAINFSAIEQHDRVSVTTKDIFEERILNVLKRASTDRYSVTGNVREFFKYGNEIINLPNGEMALKVAADIDESAGNISHRCKLIRNRLLCVLTSGVVFKSAMLVFVLSIPIIFVLKSSMTSGEITSPNVSSRIMSGWAAVQSDPGDRWAYIDLLRASISGAWSLMNGFPLACLLVAAALKIMRGFAVPNFKGASTLRRYENALWKIGKLSSSGQAGPHFTIKIRLGDRFSNIAGSKIMNRSSGTL